MKFIRLLFAAAVFLLAGLVPLRANPMLLVDMDTLDVLYEQDAGQPWHPASLTKLMTAYVTFQAVADGAITLDTVVIVSKAAASQAPSSSGLRAGSGITLKDALYVLLVHSANDLAWAIAETVAGSEPAFVVRMNETAERMGMTATNFTNPNGLHDKDQVTTARDLAVLALYLRQMFPQYLDIFRTETVKMGKVTMHSNNDLLTGFAGTTGMKTGYICASGLNIVATVNRGGRSLMAVVLGGSSGRERGEMTAELFLKAISGKLGPTGKTITQVSNRGGDAFDMRPLLCGKESKAYVEQRKADYPMGLEDQPTFLTDEVHGLSYAATDLGVLVSGIKLPRPRPDHLGDPVHTADVTDVVPTITPDTATVTPDNVATIVPVEIETIGASSLAGGDTPAVIPVTPEGAPVPLPRPRAGLQQD